MRNHPLHFYVVFNPLINQSGNYKSQAHEFYSQLKGRVTDSGERYLYWGKLAVNEKSSELETYREVLQANEQQGHDTHLFISDYHHFWVAKVESVHKEILKADDTIAFYDNKEVEVWFKISDMDLIAGEFEETLYYLSTLSVDNKFHPQKIDSINPYLGGLKFPMIVSDRTNEAYFRNMFAEDKFRLDKENPLIEKSSLFDQVNQSMKSFVLSPQVFGKLSTHVKKELLSVEMSLTAGRSDTSGFGDVLNSYLRILESVMNETLGKVLDHEYGSCLFIDEHGERFSDSLSDGFVPINQFSGQITMRAYINLLSDVGSFGNLSLKQTEEKYPELVHYFTGELIPFIHREELVSMRESLKGGHNIATTKERAFSVRNQILGVGCVGVINRLMELFINSQQERLYKKVS